MYGRAIIVNTRPNGRDEIAQLIRDSVIQAAKQQQGFKGYLAMLDPDTGKGIAISLWETQADLRASENSYLREQLTRVEHLFTSAPAFEVYEVLAQA